MLPIKKVLLHICCAPDGTVPWGELTAEGYEVTGFFYGNNIHPFEEFVRRKEAVLSLGHIMDGRVETCTYNPDIWMDKTKDYAAEPEGGRRCPLCFAIQLEAAARKAVELDCTYLCTTLTISPHKDPGLINEIGEKAASSFGLSWVNRIWRKKGGFQRSVKMSREMKLYRQSYCGCLYSIEGDDSSK